MSDKFRMFEAETCSIILAFQLSFKLYHYKGPENQEGLKPTGLHQLLAYGDVN
jgi:hypothetical protein